MTNIEEITEFMCKHFNAEMNKELEHYYYLHFFHDTITIGDIPNAYKSYVHTSHDTELMAYNFFNFENAFEEILIKLKELEIPFFFDINNGVYWIGEGENDHILSETDVVFCWKDGKLSFYAPIYFNGDRDSKKCNTEFCNQYPEFTNILEQFRILNKT